MIKSLEHVVLCFFSRTTYTFLTERFRKVCSQYYCSACNGRCTAVSEPENAMKCRKARECEGEGSWKRRKGVGGGGELKRNERSWKGRGAGGEESSVWL